MDMYLKINFESIVLSFKVCFNMWPNVIVLLGGKCFNCELTALYADV